MRNRNHPKRGSTTRVSGLRTLEEVKRVKALLRDQPRNLLLWTLGVNNGLRPGDLLALKVGQVRTLEEDDYVPIVERKTGKRNILMVNGESHGVLHDYLDAGTLRDGDWLFPNSNDPRKHLSVIATNLLIKRWTRETGINHGNYGAHTLRKTFGVIQRLEFGTPIELISKRFNHSSLKVTEVYLDIEEEEVVEILRNSI